MSLLAVGIASQLQGGLNPLNWLTGPMGRDADYASNRFFTALQSLPPPPVLISLYYAGKFGDPNTAVATDRLWSYLENFGIQRIGSSPLSRDRAVASRTMVDMARPFLPIGDWLSAYRSGFAGTTRREVELLLGRAGILDAQQQSIAIDLGVPPSPGDTLRWYFSELIDDETASKWLNWSGYTNADVIAAAKAARPPISLGEAIQLANREVLSISEWATNLKRMGYGDPDQQIQLAELLKQIPGPSDLIRFSVREVWDENVVREFGYDEEFPQEAAYWLRQQGYDWTEDVTLPDGSTVPGVKWPLAYWRSHWQVISPGQAYEMLHRLRGDPANPATWRVPGVKPFTIDDVKRVLKIADYPAPFRDRLAAISYRPIGIRQIRQLVAANIWGRAELLEGYQDLGYSPASADTLARMDLETERTKRLKSLESGQRTRVLRGYEVGIISRDQAAVQLYALSLTSAAATDRFTALFIGEQIAVANRDPVIRQTLDSIDTDLSVSLARSAIAAIRSSFLRYETSDSAAQLALEEIGVSQVRIDRYLQGWQWARYRRGKSLAVGQIRQTVIRGVVTPQDALARLSTLGYLPVDALALLTMWSSDHQLYISRAQQSLARSAAAQQRALIRQQRELQRQLKQTQAQLAYNAPVGKLKKWLGKGLISEAEARMRMAALGHDTQFISREIADATTKLEYTRTKRAAVIAEKPEPPTTIPAGAG